MKEDNCYVRGLKPYIRKEIMEELQRIPPNMRSNLIEIKRMETENVRSERALMEHVQLR